MRQEYHYAFAISPTNCEVFFGTEVSLVDIDPHGIKNLSSVSLCDVLCCTLSNSPKRVTVFAHSEIKVALQDPFVAHLLCGARRQHLSVTRS